MFGGRVNPRIAVVGAGIAGLALASRLAPHANVSVFEKSRGLGGRMTNRRAETWSFDHGTQFFTARDPAFRAFIDPLITSGTVAEWRGQLVYLEAGKKPRKRLWFEPHYVASPTMSALCKHLGAGLDIRAATEIAPLAARTGAGWALEDTAGTVLGEFDLVISTAPAPQTLRLFDTHLPADSPLRGVRYRSCFALMAGLDPAWQPGWIAGKARDNPIEWVAVQATRPGRSAASALVAHASADWSDAHLEAPPADVEKTLLAELEALTGMPSDAVQYVSLHRWRYALLDTATATGSAWLDLDAGLAAAGDWCTASRIEDAWRAGQSLASELLD